MSALPDDPAVLEDDDLVSADDRRHPLGDEENDRVGCPRPQGGAQAGIGGDVEGGEGVVEEIELRVLYNGPGYGQALALAAGEVAPPLL